MPIRGVATLRWTIPLGTAALALQVVADLIGAEKTQFQFTCIVSLSCHFRFSQGLTEFTQRQSLALYMAPIPTATLAALRVGTQTSLPLASR
jgi:hypothetical protein